MEKEKRLLRRPSRSSPPIRTVSEASRRGMDVSFKAALILLLPALAIRLAFIFGMNLPGFLLYFLLAVLYLLAGWMAANFYLQRNRPQRISRRVNVPREKGVIAGITLCILSWAIALLLLIIADMMSANFTARMSGAVMALSAFTEVFASMLLAALGTKLAVSNYR